MHYVSHRISGEVRDAELCQPISGVRVSVVVSPEICTWSGEDGKWSLDVPNGTPIRFEKERFQLKEYSDRPPPRLVRLLSNRLLGYHDKLHFLPGESTVVRVHATEAYRARLFRYGSDRELVCDFGEHPPRFQTVPDGHFVDHGLEWSDTFSYTIPSDARPGLYSLCLESIDNPGERFAIPMVVSTPPEDYGKTSRLLVLASNTTWQSYNIWGGRSRYRNFEQAGESGFHRVSTGTVVRDIARRLLPSPILGFIRTLKSCVRAGGEKRQKQEAWKFNRLSVRRPFTNCGLEEHEDVIQPFTNHLAAGEWRVLAWLEREGIDYDFVSGFELHSNPNLLSHYKAFALSTHCEYWTKAMFETLRDHHMESGLSILNLSGNSIYRRIDFFEDASTRCVSLRFHHGCTDETEVIGVRFDMSDYASCAPYRVLCPNHFLFEGCGFEESSTFGKESLNRNTPISSHHYNPGRPGSGRQGSEFELHGCGASGWETDKLNPERRKDFTVLAKGLNPNGGADMIFRDRKGSRGMVFSASSLTYGGTLLIDPKVSRLTANAIHYSLE